MPNNEDLDQRIIERGKLFFQLIQNQTPSLFSKNHWLGQMLDWSMRNQAFKINLFRFIDVFPVLTSRESLTQHIKEYFIKSGVNSTPAVIKHAIQWARFTGPLGAWVLNAFITFNIKQMAKQFIIGETTSDAVKSLERLRKNGFAFTVDVLGEATITEEESDLHQAIYLNLLEVLSKHQNHWAPLIAANRLPTKLDCDWDYAPLIQLSIKVSGLYSQIHPVDFENSVQAILQNLKKVYRKVIEVKGSLCIDMEQSQLKNITLEVFRRLRADPEFSHYPHLGIVLQAYLKETANDLEDLLHWARVQNLPIEVRLVKGAYWDYEFITATQNNWIQPVWLHKAETDIAFEQLSRKILENQDICYFACGSHNIRSIAAVMEIAKELKVPESRYEFQVLYGMAEPIRNALKELTGRVRLYSPYGEMIPGMAYLVRRLLENTANESFLRQSFSQHKKIEKLLQNPQKTLNLEEKQCI